MSAVAQPQLTMNSAENDPAVLKKEVFAGMAASLIFETGSWARRQQTETSVIDFYDEIRRFEIHLIKRALEMTGYCQKNAARLLSLHTSTLNSKIKMYGIVKSGPAQISATSSRRATVNGKGRGQGPALTLTNNPTPDPSGGTHHVVAKMPRRRE